MMSSTHTPDLFYSGIGERLRKARMEAGLDVAEVSRRLRMPSRVIEALEAEDWGRLDAPVYVRGQLRSYARLLGVQLDDRLPMSARVPVEPSRLEPRTYTPPMQRFAEKLMGRMVYVVITALIAVPVWMATRGHLDGSTITASLDSPSSSMTTDASSAPHKQAPTQPRPLVASMASLPRATEPAKSVPALSLRFDADSWVEITATDGSRLEHGLVKAGEQRDFDAGRIGKVVLGNAGAVEVLRLGRVQDLSAFQRANVARFTVSSDGSLAPVEQ